MQEEPIQADARLSARGTQAGTSVNWYWDRDPDLKPQLAPCHGGGWTSSGVHR